MLRTAMGPLRGACVLGVLCLLCVAPLVAALRDYYDVLGVKRSASEREIKSSYRKIARAIHPDKHPEKAAEVRVPLTSLWNSARRTRS